VTDPIRIYIGTEPKTKIAADVLSFSIRRHTKSPVEITYMEGPAWEYPLDGIKVGTGFSLRRWMIPKACDWKGRAIYLDADQLVFGDIKELWEKPEYLPLEGSSDTAVIWCSFQPDKFSVKPWPQTSVMVIDCERAKLYGQFLLERILALLQGADQRIYADFMHGKYIDGHVLPLRPLRIARIGDEWNHLNKYVLKGQPEHTRLLHYTKEPEQPWYKPDHPFAFLWREELVLAIRAGVINKGEFEAALAKWNVKEDWRNTNGLHPFYAKYLSLFPHGASL